MNFNEKKNCDVNLKYNSFHQDNTASYADVAGIFDGRKRKIAKACLIGW
jgi:hypothetical protein